MHRHMKHHKLKGTVLSKTL